MSGSFFKGGLEKFGFNKISFLFKIFLKVRNNLIRQADAFVSISSEITSELKNYKVKGENIFEIPNCFDQEKFYPITQDKKTKIRNKLMLSLDYKIIIFTGRLLSTKGLPLLLRVWNEIQKYHQNVLLLIVGSGEDLSYSCEAKIQEYTLKKSIQDSVLFVGNVNNVHEYLQSSDIFCFPTENEAFGISLIEAMACGLVSIATPVGGIKDIIKHKQNGYLIETGNFDQLYFYLDLLLKDDKIISNMRENSYLSVKDKYSKLSVAQKYIDLFTKLASQNSGNYLSYPGNIRN